MHFAIKKASLASTVHTVDKRWCIEILNMMMINVSKNDVIITYPEALIEELFLMENLMFRETE